MKKFELGYIRILGPCEHLECAKETSGNSFQLQQNNNFITVDINNIPAIIDSLKQIYENKKN